MKKQLIFLFAVVLLIFLINIFSRDIIKVKNINKREVIYLSKRKKQEKVYGFWVHIYGYIDGKAKVAMYQNSAKGNLHKTATISSDIDIKWSKECYADKIVIVYEPIGKVKSGSLKIDYKFKGL